MMLNQVKSIAVEPLNAATRFFVTEIVNVHGLQMSGPIICMPSWEMAQTFCDKYVGGAEVVGELQDTTKNLDYMDDVTYTCVMIKNAELN